MKCCCWWKYEWWILPHKLTRPKGWCWFHIEGYPLSSASYSRRSQGGRRLACPPTLCSMNSWSANNPRFRGQFRSPPSQDLEGTKNGEWYQLDGVIDGYILVVGTSVKDPTIVETPVWGRHWCGYGSCVIVWAMWTMEKSKMSKQGDVGCTAVCQVVHKRKLVVMWQSVEPHRCGRHLCLGLFS